MTEKMLGKELGDGRFKIISAEPLGRGGFATVYPGLQVQLNRKVAIKILSASAAEDAELVHRFIREARVVALFEHPNIIKVIDSGSEAGLNYFVMTYLHGTLQQLLCQHPNQNGLPLERWLKIAKQIASALDYMHSHRTIKEFVHRDIKPGNIMFDESGNAILTDFGLVKGEQFSQLTLKDTVMGTPKYMSPEQVRGLPLDQRSDLYSFGIVLYEMLLGRPPFSGEPLTICHKQISEIPPQPHSIKPDVPGPVEQIILKLIEKDPDKRFASARDLLAELEEWENMTFRRQSASSQNISRTIPVSPGTRRPAADATPTTLQPIKTDPARSPKSEPIPVPHRRLYLPGALVVLLSLVLGLYLTHSPDAPAGFVTFQSQPTAASIFVDEQLLPRQTPWTQSFPAGDTLQIRFELAEWNPIRKILIVGHADTQQVLAEFDTLLHSGLKPLPNQTQPNPAQLQIESHPSGAAIYINGEKLVHTTPLTLPDIAAGMKIIRLEKPGFLEYTENLEIEPGQNYRVNARLIQPEPTPPELGKVSIVANVWGTIWIKGESGDFGTTPTVLELPARPQPYQITVERVGYQTREGYREVVVRPGKQTELTFTLTDTSAHP